MAPHKAPERGDRTLAELQMRTDFKKYVNLDPGEARVFLLERRPAYN